MTLFMDAVRTRFDPCPVPFGWVKEVQESFSYSTKTAQAVCVAL